MPKNIFGAICYLSSAGHTGIASESIAAGLPETEFERIVIMACRVESAEKFRRESCTTKS